MVYFPTKILLATDGSEDAAQAREAAVDLARRSSSELHIVHVWHDVPSPYAHSFIQKELRRQGQEILDEQVRKIEAAGGEVAIAHLKMDERRDEAIVHLAEDIGAGLIVIGSRGFGGMKRALMGNVADSVVRHAHCPVLVVRPTRGVSRPF